LRTISRGAYSQASRPKAISHPLATVPFDAIGEQEGLPLGLLGANGGCTTFDKWQLLNVVVDQYRVLGAVQTFF
jgi:hypothetical protein